MQWWDLVPVALAALSLGCVAWGARELYHHHLASRDHRRRGLRTVGRVVHIDLVDTGFDESQQVGFPVVRFTDTAGAPREFRNPEGFRPWPEVGTRFPVWYDPRDAETPPVLLTATPNLFAIVVVVVGSFGLAAAAGVLYLNSALR